jgi:hypothetical protein
MCPSPPQGGLRQVEEEDDADGLQLREAYARLFGKKGGKECPDEKKQDGEVLRGAAKACAPCRKGARKPAQGDKRERYLRARDGMRRENGIEDEPAEREPCGYYDYAPAPTLKA